MSLKMKRCQWFLVAGLLLAISLIVGCGCGDAETVSSAPIDPRHGCWTWNCLDVSIEGAVGYRNYLVYGSAALDPDSSVRASQIRYSDFNADGIALSVADLAYLINLLHSEAAPQRQLIPYAFDVELRIDNGIVAATSEAEIGAYHFVFLNSSDTSQIQGPAESHLKLDSGLVGDTLRVLGWQTVIGDFQSECLPAGNNVLFSLPPDAFLLRAEFSDCDGNLMHVSYTPW